MYIKHALNMVYSSSAPSLSENTATDFWPNLYTDGIPAIPPRQGMPSCLSELWQQHQGQFPDLTINGRLVVTLVSTLNYLHARC